MEMKWKTVGIPQVTGKLKEFAKVCCACNTRRKLAFQTSVAAVTLLVINLYANKFLNTRIRMNPCVVAASRVLLELVFLRNGSVGLSSDFIDVDSVQFHNKYIVKK